MRVIAAALVTAAAAVVDIIACIYTSRPAGGGFGGRAAVTASAGLIAGCCGARYRRRARFGSLPVAALASLIIIGGALFIAIFTITAGFAFTRRRAGFLGCPGITRTFLNRTDAAGFYTLNIAFCTIFIYTFIAA